MKVTVVVSDGYDRFAGRLELRDERFVKELTELRILIGGEFIQGKDRAVLKGGDQ